MEAQPTVLVVDDKPNMLRLMAKVLHEVAQVHTASNGAGALAVLDDEAIDVVLCDLRMPDLTGLEVLRACKLRQPRAEFILMTAYATVETAVAALKEGAYDYLTKPFEPEEAKAIVLRALHSARPRVAVADEDELLPGLHARSRVMRELVSIVRQLAPTEICVLIVGESGSGKQRIGRAIHALSPHGEGPFTVLDCRALPSTQFVAEIERLIGGSGAGCGTLFLDGVDDLDSQAQGTLAHALERRNASIVGSAPQLRVVAATEADLEAMVSGGTFRRDLLLQLGVSTVVVPPLRKRRDDIPVLAAHLLAEMERPGARPSEAGFTAGAMELFVTARWPGNVRELRSVVEHAAALAGESRIGLEVLPESLRGDAAADAGWDTLTWADALTRGRADVARQYLVALLRRFNGDVLKAAGQAAVERESFYRLLRRHGIQPDSFRRAGGSTGDEG